MPNHHHDHNHSTEEEQSTKQQNDSSVTVPVPPLHPNNSIHGSWRQKIGYSLHVMTDTINDNLIVARYAALASIGLLTCYGISKTPLFFRYRHVSEIPSFYFRNRRTIHGRIVRIVSLHFKDATSQASSNSSHSSNTSISQPIVCLVRQLSPVGRWMNKSMYEYTMERNHTLFSISNQRSNAERYHEKEETAGRESSEDDLLKVELAGIQAPPPFYSNHQSVGGGEGGNDWLQRLALNRTPVTCTFISRRVLKLEKKTNNEQHPSHRMRMSRDVVASSVIDPEKEQVAIVKMMYRPGMALFRKDLGMSLVSHGRANVASGMHMEIPSMPTVDGSTKLGDIEADVKYLEHLSQLEYEALKARKGMWNVEKVRCTRPDLVEEADFEIHASPWKKVWRKLREGEYSWNTLKRSSKT